MKSCQYHKNKRRRPLNKAVSVFTLAVFFLSLAPMALLDLGRDGGELRNAIITVQQLYSVNETPAADFNSVFTSTIKIIQATAGLNTVITKHTTAPDAKERQITVSIRLPYLLSNSVTLGTGLLTAKLLPITHQFLYQSRTITPEIPPPLRLNA